MLKLNKVFKNKYIKNEDRVRRLMLSSFFVVYTAVLLSGCGSEKTVMSLYEEEVSLLKQSDEEEQITDEGDKENAEASESDAESEEAIIYVHICGAVNDEGVYELKGGDRVIDAIEYAGGFTDEACTDEVNLAQKVVDEQYIYIPTREEINNIYDGQTNMKISQRISSVTEASSQDGSKVDINTADKAGLMTLTGIGEVKAKSIIEYREKNGAFQSTEDIKKVSGIGEASFDKIKDEITVR